MNRKRYLGMKTGSLFVILLVLFSTSAFALNDDSDMRAQYDKQMEARDYDVAKAVILQIVKDDTQELRPNVPLEADIRYQHMEIEILDGKHKGQTLTIRHTIEYIMPGNYIFKAGEKILLRITETETGEIDTVKIEERVRDYSVYVIVLLFVAIMVLVGQKQGIKALVSLTATVLLVFLVYIPLILKGYSPLLLSVLISTVAITLTLLIISGIHKKTLVAIWGTVSGVVIAGLLAVIFGDWGKLTGLATETSISLAYIPHFRWLNYKGILFGTIIIGSIGAIMDVALSIASSMWEIWEINPEISTGKLMKSGMNIGRDIMGSMSNTLILAYVGTSIHLIILFMVYNITLVEIMNYDSVSSEILRAMAGSIGLMLTIPATVWLSAIFYKKLTIRKPAK